MPPRTRDNFNQTVAVPGIYSLERRDKKKQRNETEKWTVGENISYKGKGNIMYHYRHGVITKVTDRDMHNKRT